MTLDPSRPFSEQLHLREGPRIEIPLSELFGRPPERRVRITHVDHENLAIYFEDVDEPEGQS